MKRRTNLSSDVIEMISDIIGDTNEGLTEKEIHRLLLQAGIEDISYNEQYMAKRKKLFLSQFPK